MGINLFTDEALIVKVRQGSCVHEEVLLNPDAVAVKWYKCRLCGQTRREDVRKEIW